MPPRLALCALLLTLAACASQPRGERADGSEGRPRAQRVRLFISPSGEPFRGENGLAAWFAGADADHDGAISEAEFAADAQRFFRKLDKNGDGKLDGFEIQAYEHDVVPEIGTVDLLEPLAESEPRRGGFGGGGRRGRGGRGGPGRESGDAGGQAGGSALGGEPARARPAGREGAARYALLNEPEPVANADADVDGQVSAAEWKTATARRFARLDRGHTGKLILSDLLLPRGARKPSPPSMPLPGPPR